MLEKLKNISDVLKGTDMNEIVLAPSEKEVDTIKSELYSEFGIIIQDKVVEKTSSDKIRIDTKRDLVYKAFNITYEIKLFGILFILKSIEYALNDIINAKNSSITTVK